MIYAFLFFTILNTVLSVGILFVQLSIGRILVNLTEDNEPKDNEPGLIDIRNTENYHNRIPPVDIG